ncbi:MAG: MchE protein, partial [Planctomycetota bacterium]
MKILVGPLAVVALLLGVWASRDRGAKSDAAADTDAETNARAPDLQILELGPQARRNLRLKSAPARPTSYWRTITIPGMVEDRPGISDRGVTSPAVGSVAEIHVYPGDTVRPGEAIVSISLFSEYLQATQTQLFKAHQETLLLEQEVDRLSAVASAGGIAGAKLIQLENDRQRQQTLIKSARQELLNRGLSPGQVDQVVEGSFVSTIQVVAPPSRTVKQLFEYAEVKPVKDDETARNQRDVSIAYEVQSLAVELGQTVQAGQLIAGLANHEHLYVVGHAFKREAGLLEQAAQDERELEIEFSDDDVSRWSSIVQSFQIRHLSNSIDVESRTFVFFF